MNDQTQIETCNSLIQDALQHADAFDRTNIDRLAALAKQEASIGCVSQPHAIAAPAGDLPRNLAAIAKAIRLAGEYPYYVAEVMAVWFAAQKGAVAEFIAANGIKAAVSSYCGIQYERELIQMVAAFYKALPSLGVDNAEKVELMKEAYRQGDHYEKVYRGCAQCHMAAVSDVTGKEDKVMFRAANGFAAGMGLLGDGVCGGYSGGILSLGLFAGRRKEFFDGDKQEKEIITKLVAKLHDKYIDTYGSLICHDIHQEIFGRAFHIKEPQDKEAFELAGAHTLDKCPAVVGTSAAWVVEILYDEGFMSGKAEAGK
jgi:C_GCAxxG_C_C family probable redox protein